MPKVVYEALADSSADLQEHLSETFDTLEAALAACKAALGGVISPRATIHEIEVADDGTSIETREWRFEDFGEWTLTNNG